MEEDSHKSERFTEDQLRLLQDMRFIATLATKHALSETGQEVFGMVLHAIKSGLTLEEAWENAEGIESLSDEDIYELEKWMIIRLFIEDFESGYLLGE